MSDLFLTRQKIQEMLPESGQEPGKVWKTTKGNPES